MKKALVICLAMVLVLSLSVTALAVPGGFVKSPSGNRAPNVTIFDPLDDDCTADLIITIFGDRVNLPEDQRQPFEDAYNEIISTDNLTNLNNELADLASKLDIDPEKLGVSDLFDLSCEGCEDHTGHEKFKVTMEVDGLEHFVGVIYRDEEGKWHLVEDAKAEDGKLEFTAQGYYPHAIVVDTTNSQPDQDDPGQDKPGQDKPGQDKPGQDKPGQDKPGQDKPSEDKPSKTGDTNLVVICGAVMVVAAVGLAVVLIMRKKQRS